MVWAMVLQYAVGGAILPFLTLLLRDRGFGVADISRLLLSGAVVLLIAPFVWGMLADRFVPLNRLFVVMNLLGALFLGWFAAGQGGPGVRLAFIGFYACFQPAPILVNALALRHLANAHQDFSRLRAWGSLGWILPSLPIYVWMVRGGEHDLGFVVWLALVCSVAMAAASCWLPHTAPGAATARARPSASYWSAIRRLLAHREFRLLLGSYALVSAAFAIQSFYAPPRLEDLGLSRPAIGLAASAGVLWEILLFQRRDSVLRWLGPKGAVAAGCVALVLRQALFAFEWSPWLLAWSYLLVGTTVVLYHIGVSLMIESLAGGEVKSTAQTLLTLCSSGVGPIAGFASVGWLAGLGLGLGAVFGFSALLAATASLLLWLGWRRRT